MFVKRMKAPTPFSLMREMIIGSPLHWRNQILGCRLSPIEDSEVLSLILRGYSFVRWGDGETAIARGKSIHYQIFNEELQKKLRSLLLVPPIKTIFGVSWVVYSSIFDARWNKRIFGIMFSTRVYWAKMCRSQFNQVRISRTEFWWNNADNISSILEILQNNGRNLILVGPRKFIALCPKKTELIEIKPVDAFAEYENLHRAVLSAHRKYGESLTLVVAAGPTSKALVHDFASRLQILDIGHGLDFALHGQGSWSWSSRNSDEKESEIE